MCAFSELAFKKPAFKYPPPTATPIFPASRHWSAGADELRPRTLGGGSSASEALGKSNTKGCRIMLRDADCIACKPDSDSNTCTLFSLRILAMNFPPWCQTYFIPRPLAADLKLQKSLYLSFESGPLTNEISYKFWPTMRLPRQAKISPNHLCKS